MDVEPFSKFQSYDEEDINNVIKNTLKIQAKIYKYNNTINKASKCSLNETYIKKDNVLKNKFNKKGKFRIPIIIELLFKSLYVVLNIVLK